MAVVVVNRPAIAPYAGVAIPLYLDSTNGMRYRNLHCIECGREFLERNNDTMYRINDTSQPTEVRIAANTPIEAKCGNCTQTYIVSVAVSIVYERDGIPLHMQPQTLHLVIEQQKQLRYISCLECGKVIHSISDRIGHMTDNRVPFEYLSPNRLGPMEAICRENDCRQSWTLMV